VKRRRKVTCGKEIKIAPDGSHESKGSITGLVYLNWPRGNWPASQRPHANEEEGAGPSYTGMCIDRSCVAGKENWARGGR